MDLPVSLGTSAAYFYSVYLMASGAAHDLYFEAAVVVIAADCGAGNGLKHEPNARPREAIRSLMSLRPETARIERDGGEIEVSAGAVAVGDIVVLGQARNCRSMASSSPVTATLTRVRSGESRSRCQDAGR